MKVSSGNVTLFVEVRHHEYDEPDHVNAHHLVSHMTKVEIYDENHESLGAGYAYCSVKDNFSKEIGRKIALKRAIADAMVSHSPVNYPSVRGCIWRKLFPKYFLTKEKSRV